MSRNLVEIVRRAGDRHELQADLLVGSPADVDTSCPEYRVVAVDVRPVAEQASRTPAIAAAT